MKKVLLALSLLFNALAIAGAGYVLLNHGTVNAGYAVVPMVLGLSCLTCYRALSSNNKKVSDCEK